MNSMTGFGRAPFDVEGIEYRVEVRTLNSRFLDVKLRLPWSDGEIETQCTAAVRERLSRGRVEVSVREQHASENPKTREISINTAVAAQVGAALKEAAAAMDCDTQTAAQLLPRVPDLVSTQTRRLSGSEIWAHFNSALRQALDELLAMRDREGNALEADLKGNLSALESLVDRVEALVKAEPEQAQQRLVDRIQKLAGDVKMDPARLTQEIAILAERCDINEEITRFRSHASQLHDMMKQSEPIGRPFEFMLQEVNRELNTIASKTSSAEAARLTVDAKGFLEKLREQAQNVE